MENIKEKLDNIELVAFDVDGVLTDGSISYTDQGVEIKTFNAKDGQGLALLVKEGFVTAIITARKSSIVEKRAKELGITHLYQGAKNKIVALDEMLTKYGIDYSNVAYVGDDLPDICILEKVALACCPLDAVDEVKNVCNFISKKPGGKGAVREITDMIIMSKRLRLNQTISSGVNLPSFNKQQ